jgi:hypothetical protein
VDQPIFSHLEFYAERAAGWANLGFVKGSAFLTRRNGFTAFSPNKNHFVSWSIRMPGSGRKHFDSLASVSGCCGAPLPLIAVVKKLVLSLRPSDGSDERFRRWRIAACDEFPDPRSGAPYRQMAAT